MALAIWDITTITSGTVLYGATSRWVTFPDAFPPAGYLMTTTPTRATSAYGLYVEYMASTTPVWTTVTFSSAGGVLCVGIPIKVRSYQKGTRSFILDQAWATITAALPEQTRATTTVGRAPLKRLILYYRAMDEYGETPS